MERKGKEKQNTSSLAEEQEDVVPDEEFEDGHTSIKRLRERLKACEAEKKEYLDGWQRLQADVSNIRKEASKSGELAGDNAIKSILTKLLPLIDALEAAQSHMNAETKEESWKEGIHAVYAQIQSLLREYAVEIIDPGGVIFDPTLHEAVGSEETEEPAKEDVIKAVLQKGYRKGDFVLRPARVIVYKLSN